MTNQNIETLIRVFNTLMLVETHGENTIAMGQCLQAIQSVIQSEQVDNDQPAPETEVEGE